MPFRRRRWDAQPTDRSEVLLAADGRRDFSSTAVVRAADLAGSDGRVAVVTIAKIYGTQFGLPHPGLLPTKQEMQERQEWVGNAVAYLRRRGLDADGQVAATRRATKKLAEIARLRGVRVIVIDESRATGLRRMIEGDTGRELRRKLRRDAIQVEVVPSPSTRSAG
jgi:hypothetical protein